MLRGSVQAPDAQSALANFPCSPYVNDDGHTLADYAHIPFADHRDTAVGYEDADPHRPIVWLATYHRP